MVFKSRPLRQSPFLSSEPASVATVKSQLIDLWTHLKKLAICNGCIIKNDYSIDFQDGGELTFPLYRFQIPNALLNIAIDTSKTTAALVYDIKESGVTKFLGTMRNDANVLEAPFHGMVLPTLTLRAPSAGTIYFLVFRVVETSYYGNVAARFPYPVHVAGGVITPWRQRKAPKYYTIEFRWRSRDGAAASITYRENNITVATLSTTSTSFVTSAISRVWLRRHQIIFNYSASNNAEIAYVHVYMFLEAPLPLLPTRSLQSSYSTTSTSYVQYTPLNLSATTARVRKIVVSGSSNARWYVNIDGNKVLDSAWGINSLDFNPPQDAKRVDLFLASADGTNATASIIIIYDELPNV